MGVGARGTGRGRAVLEALTFQVRGSAHTVMFLCCKSKVFYVLSVAITCLPVTLPHGWGRVGVDKAVCESVPSGVCVGDSLSLGLVD